MFDVDAERAAGVVDAVVGFRADYVMGYTSTLALIADEMERRQRRLERRLKGVVAIAENLTEDRERAIRRFFRAPIINRYGQREFKFWCAQSCAEASGRLHVNTELVEAEILRRDGTPCEPGEVGRLVLTNFHNFVMPFIRYDTGDLAAFAKDPCPCGRGFPVIERLEGRSREVFNSPDGRMVSPVALGQYLFVTRDWVGRLRHYQLIHEAADRVRMRVVPAGPLDPTDERHLRDDLQELLGRQVSVDIECVAEIPLERSGKRPIIKRTFGET